MKSQYVDLVLFAFILTLALLVLYGLVVTIMHMYCNYVIILMIITLIYFYSIWIIKETSDIEGYDYNQKQNVLGANAGKGAMIRYEPYQRLQKNFL